MNTSNVMLQNDWYRVARCMNILLYSGRGSRRLEIVKIKTVRIYRHFDILGDKSYTVNINAYRIFTSTNPFSRLGKDGVGTRVSVTSVRATYTIFRTSGRYKAYIIIYYMQYRFRRRLRENGARGFANKILLLIRTGKPVESRHVWEWGGGGGVDF